ncbi:MAG: hypothetical protein U1E65_35975 [Myxococcota bacterium]
MNRTKLVLLLALAAGCAHGPTPGTVLPPPRPLPIAEARALASTLAPEDAADVLYFEANDRAAAEAALKKAPHPSPGAALRFGLLREAVLDHAGAAKALAEAVALDPLSPEGELALILLFESAGGNPAYADALRSLPERTEKKAFAPGAKPLLYASIIRARGDNPPDPALTAAGGFLTGWEVLGPLGPRAPIALEKPTKAELQGIGDPEASGGHRGAPAILRPCPMEGVELMPMLGTLDGLYVAERWLQSPEEERLVLSVGWRGPGRLSIDGQVILHRDFDQPRQPEWSSVELSLPAGRHRLSVAYLFGDGAGVAVSLLGPDGAPANTKAVDRAGGPASSAALAFSLLSPAPIRARPYAEAMFAALRAESGLVRDLEEARQRLRPLLPGARSSAVAQALEAQLWASEGVAPSQMQAALRRALALDPENPRINLALARSLSRDDPDRALALATAAASRAPWAAEPEMQRFHILRDRSRNAEAEQALSKALALGPNAAHLDEGARFLRSMLRIGEAEALEERAEAQKSPNKRSLARLLRRGQQEQALALLLARAEKDPRPVADLVEAASMELGRDQVDAARAHAERALALDPYAVPALRLLVQVALQKQDAALLAQTSAALERLGAADLELLVAKADGRSLALDSPWLKARVSVDAKALAQAPLDPAFSHDRRVVLLDQLVDTVRPDGSALTYRHSLVRLQTKEATDMHGELELPDGALALTLRTLKPDGRAIEVDRHEGKDDLSFSALAVGDTVEEEWVATDAPETMYGGYARRFFFKSDSATLRSELVVVVPKGHPVRIYRYHGAPAPVQHEEADRVIYAFTATAAHGLPREPFAPSPEEFLPFVVVTVDLDAEQALDQNRAGLLGRARLGFDVRAMTASITAGLSTVPERLERVARFLSEEIQPGPGSDPEETLLERKGDRSSLAAAMLRSAGMDAELVLASAPTAVEAPLPDPYPRARAFQTPLVKVRAEGRDDLYLYAGGADVWVGRAPAELAGARLLSAAPGAPIETIDPNQVADCTIKTKVALRIDPAGNAQGKIEMRIPGLLGQGIRHALKPLRKEDQLRGLQAWLNAMIPGARLVELGTEGERWDPEVISLVIEVADFLTPEANTWVASRFFDGPMGMRVLGLPPLEAYLNISSRNMPLVTARAREELDVTIELPPGLGSILEAPQSFEQRAPFALVSQKSSYDPAQRLLHLVALHDVQAARIAVENFAAFRKFAEEVTLRTRNRLVVGAGSAKQL